MTDRQKIERLKKLTKATQTADKSKQDDAEILARKKRWTTYFRKNPEIYIEKKMGFHSFGYQNFSYHLMQEANQYIEVSTRGVGKSLRVIVFACFRALMYPNSKIGVTAVGSSQANENFLTAFMQEIIFKYSPFMKWLYDNKLITTRETDKGYTATFWNGSIIYFFACINSSRGLHVDTLIGEELRLIKRADWDSIAMPMLVARRAGYRSRPEYADRIDLDEDTKVICITSNRFKNEWFNTMFNTTFTNYFKNTLTDNRVLCCDIFLALKHGLKKPSWYLQQKNEMEELSFRMEILNETIGEVEGCYFTWDMFRKNQVLKKAFRPPNEEEFINNTVKNRAKKPKEFRLLFVDFAFANGDNNDNTVIGCMSCQPKNDVWLRDVEYIETHGGGNGDESLLRIRELYQDYKADYIVVDLRNGGEVHYNALTKQFEHPNRSAHEWDSRGFTVARDTNIHMVGKAKLEDLRARTVDKDAIPCIVPISANSEFNSNMWIDLKNKLRDEELRFLVDDLEFRQGLEAEKDYFKLTSAEKARIVYPYQQTLNLINEAVNLTATWKGGAVALSEGNSVTAMKDRIVALGYGNAIATKVINQLDINSGSNDFDIDEWQLVY